MLRSELFAAIYSVVSTVPAGRVITYGQAAAACGCSARTVGWALAMLSDAKVPWHRVVGAGGKISIAKRSPELGATQRVLLIDEGAHFTSAGCVDMTQHGVISEGDLLLNHDGEILRF